MKIIPITFAEAASYVNRGHRHLEASRGCKFCIGCEDRGKIVGVAMCGRPVSRVLDNGRTLEITRVCTDGTRNACSMLYGACCRIAKEMGYEKVITYTLQSEIGTSLKASNFICEGPAGGIRWTGSRSRRNRRTDLPAERKIRWSMRIIQKGD